MTGPGHATRLRSALLPAQAPLAHSRRSLGLVFGLTGVTIFGGSFPATRLAVADLDPWFVTAARAAIGGLLALAAVAALRRRLPREHIGPLLVVALCVVLGFPILSAIALTTVPAAHGGVILALLPLATAAAAVIFAGERPSPLFWVFAALGSAIVLVFALRESNLTLVAGDIYLLLSVAAAAIGYAISGRLTRALPGWEVISWALVLTLPVSLAATLLLWPSNVADVSVPAWLGLAYVGAMSQYIGFWAWNAALAIGGVARVGQLQLLQPFVTFALSALVLSETITPETIAFALAVVVVVAIGRRAVVTQVAPAD